MPDYNNDIIPEFVKRMRIESSDCFIKNDNSDMGRMRGMSENKERPGEEYEVSSSNSTTS